MDSMTAEQRSTFDYITSESDQVKRVIIQGSAGTGKSYLIKHVKEYLLSKDLNVVCTSHTGLASSLINGPTIYKLFKFNLERTCGSVIMGRHRYLCTKKEIGDSFALTSKSWLTPGYYVAHSFNEVPEKNYIIIDEISMIGLEFLDDIECLLRACFNKDELFGGVNMIFVGDMYQLPPVKEVSIINAKPDHFVYTFKFFELSINKRQDNTEFAELCNAFRTGLLSSKQKRMLLERRVENFPQDVYQDLIHIYPTRVLCHKHNLKMLNRIESGGVFYFVLSEDLTPYPNNLPIKQHEVFQGLPYRFVVTEKSKVMITRNINEKLFNGCIDVVDKIIFTQQENSDLREEFYKMPKVDIEEYRRIEKFVIDRGDKVVFCKPDELSIHLAKNDIECFPTMATLIGSDNVYFRRRMFPLQMTWAVTTHKIQGVTLDEGVIDLSENNFDPVQLYVNISRLRSIDNLYITALSLPLSRNTTRKRIREFVSTFRSIESAK